MTNFEEYGLADGKKSVNAHNCRKFAMLTKMFIGHKLIVLQNFEASKFEIEKTFTQYAKAYLELTSVVSDLQMYVLHLDVYQREKILECLQNHVETKTDQPLRMAKA